MRCEKGQELERPLLGSYLADGQRLPSLTAPAPAVSADARRRGRNRSWGEGVGVVWGAGNTAKVGGRKGYQASSLWWLLLWLVWVLEAVPAGSGRVRTQGWGGASFCPSGGFSSQVGLIRQSY